MWGSKRPKTSQLNFIILSISPHPLFPCHLTSPISSIPDSPSNRQKFSRRWPHWKDSGIRAGFSISNDANIIVIFPYRKVSPLLERPRSSSPYLSIDWCCRIWWSIGASTSDKRADCGILLLVREISQYECIMTRWLRDWREGRVFWIFRGWSHIRLRRRVIQSFIFRNIVNFNVKILNSGNYSVQSISFILIILVPDDCNA